MIEIRVLASGSRGNATLVRGGDAALLIDAGISSRQLTQRLEAAGQDPRRLTAILLTHEHQDHTAGLKVFTKSFALPVFGNAATLAAAAPHLGRRAEPQVFVTGVRFDLGAFCVTAFRVPHDAAEPVGFVVEAEGLRVGYATDLGHVTPEVRARLAGCRALVFEANHDREMLMAGPYPWVTKQRVASHTGHLSNDHAADCLPEIAGGETAALVLAHISETNNDPLLARATVETSLRAAGRTAIEVLTAPQDRPAPAVTL